MIRHAGMARSGCQEGGQHLDECGFAGAIRAEQSEEFTLLHLKVNALQRNQFLAGLAFLFASADLVDAPQTLDFDG